MRPLHMLSQILILGFSFSAFGQKDISINDVAELVKKQNFTVLEKANRVYQAKQSIKAARGDLLPKLNLWKLGRVVLEWANVIPTLLEVGPDIAPFLVPNNWFRLKQTKILYKAEKEGFRALSANEVLTAKLLFMKVMVDKMFYEISSSEGEKLEELHKIAKLRVKLGSAHPELAKELEIWQLDIKEDNRNIGLLIHQEVNELSYALGLPKEKQVNLVNLDLPNLENKNPLNYEKFIFRAIDSSAEIRQNEYFQKVLPWVKAGYWFSFLGGSSISRGVAGGVFDHLPESDGLGFGIGPKLKIVKGEKKILQIQNKGIRETIKRQLDLVVTSHNSALAAYKSAKRRLQISEDIVKTAYRRLKMGDQTLDLKETAGSIHNLIISKLRLAGIGINYLMTKDRLERLIYFGHYDFSPVSLEAL